MDSMTKPGGDTLQFIFGLRKPGSERLSFNDAFVVAKSFASREITAVIFENGADFIAHPKSYREAMATYKELCAEGWLPMDREDLEKVSGSAKDIVASTSLNPSDYNWSRQDKIFARYVYVGLGLACLGAALMMRRCC